MPSIQPEVRVAKGKGRNPGTGNAALTGGGPSIVGVSGAMRARDVSRVKAEHETQAAKRLVIRRRPPDPPGDAPRTS